MNTEKIYINCNENRNISQYEEKCVLLRFSWQNAQSFYFFQMMLTFKFIVVYLFCLCVIWYVEFLSDCWRFNKLWPLKNVNQLGIQISSLVNWIIDVLSSWCVVRERIWLIKQEAWINVSKKLTFGRFIVLKYLIWICQKTGSIINIVSHKCYQNRV